MSHAQLNAGARAGLAAAEEHLPALTRAYARALRAAGRRAAARLEQTAPRVLTAAAEPEPPPWIPPPPGSLIDSEELAADTERKTASGHRLILAAAGNAAAEPLGISFDISAPASEAVLAQFAGRIQATIADAIAEQVSGATSAGYASGDSVATVARAIRDRTSEISRVRADMLARSDLNGLANSGSLLMAQVSGASATKTWLSAEDERVRETHAEADGQTVAIDDVFDVGGESAMYPGDPSLSWEEAANCRCTLVYGQPLTASAASNGHGPLAGALPFQIQVPQAPRPVTRVNVAAPEVTVQNRVEVAPPDLAALEEALAAQGPLMAAAFSEHLAELLPLLQALLAVAERELPSPLVTVAAAEVAPPDLRDLAAAVSSLLPALAAVRGLLERAVAVLENPPARSLVAEYNNIGEITRLRIEPG